MMLVVLNLVSITSTSAYQYQDLGSISGHSATQELKLKVIAHSQFSSNQVQFFLLQFYW